MHSRDLLHAAADHAADFLESLPDAPVGARETDVRALRKRLDGALPEGPRDPAIVLEELVAAVEPGLVRSQSPRYFGYVIGGTLPTALAADWMTVAWDQNAGGYVVAPAASVVEEVAGAWLKELLGLPADASFGLVTGCQTAHVTCLAAARHHVLAAVGWDVLEGGLQGAPRMRILVGEQRHVTIDRAARLLGLGSNAIVAVGTDAAGRMDPEALRGVLGAEDGPAVVCVQAGDVNTGGFDPFEPIIDAAHQAGAWVHVDGAFGLWAAASPRHRALLAGAERADSWATDAHKWLNVPYDSGLAFVAHPEAHRAGLGVAADYLQFAEQGERDQVEFNPEFSRRARGMAVYAALRGLGRAGVQELIERCCACARRFAELLGAAAGVEILNDVVLNQVLVRFEDDDEVTDAVLAAVQADGTCWLSGSAWQGRRVMRISVCNWATTPADVERSAAAIMRCVQAVASARAPSTR